MNEKDAMYKLAQIIGDYIVKLEADRDFHKTMHEFYENQTKENNDDRERVQGAPSCEQINSLGAETVTGTL